MGGGGDDEPARHGDLRGRKVTMLLSSRRYGSLRDLIQSQLADLTSNDVPGIVVMLPHLKRVDVYTTLGTSAEPTTEFYESLPWVLAEQSGDGWICREVDTASRDRFISHMTSQ
jgi:hypothetical protein